MKLKRPHHMRINDYGGESTSEAGFLIYNGLTTKSYTLRWFLFKLKDMVVSTIVYHALGFSLRFWEP